MGKSYCYGARELSDANIFFLIKRHGYEGLGVYFRLLCLLAAHDGELKVSLDSLSDWVKCREDLLRSVVTDFNLFVYENDCLQSIEQMNQDKRQKKTKIFVPPTVEQVRAYCQERRNNVDAEHFVSFYDSKGWKVGKDKMKDWQAAVRTWERMNKSSSVMAVTNHSRKDYEQGF